MKRASLATLVFALAAGSAAAATFEPAVRVTGVYDDNARNAQRNEEDDISLQGQLRLRLASERKQRLTWDLEYRPRYEKFLDLDDLDDFRHDARASLGYQLTDATRLDGIMRFSRTSRSSRRGPENDDAAAPGDPEVTRGDEDIDRGSLTIGLLHRFSPRWSLDGGAGYDFANYEGDIRSDFQSFYGNVSIRYALSRRQSLGTGLVVSRQILDETRTRDERVTDFVNLSGSWSYQISKLWNVALSAGPTYIRNEDRGEPASVLFNLVEFPGPVNGDKIRTFFDAGTCSREGGVLFVSDQCRALDPPPLPPGAVQTVNTTTGGALNNRVDATLTNLQDFDAENDQLTAFSAFALTRTGRNTRWSLGFTRREGGNFGGSSSTVVSSLSSTILWTPSEKWTVVASGTYSLRESATETTQTAVVIRAAGPGNMFGVDERAARLTRELRLVEIDDAIDVKTSTARFEVRRRITKRFTTRFGMRYRDQDNESEFQGTRDVENVEGFVGFDYRFDPIHL